MEDFGTIVLTVVVVVAFTALLSWFSWRKRKQSWEGVVTEIGSKRVVRNRLEEDEAPIYDDFVVIRYRTDLGKKGKLSVPTHGFEKYFSGLQVGERLIKESGQDLPRRVDPPKA
jgi:hypothetical protein